MIYALVRNSDFDSIDLEFQQSQDPSSNSTSVNLNLGNNKFMSAFTENFSKVKEKVGDMMKKERSNVNISPIMATMLFRYQKKLANEFCRKIEDPIHKRRLADFCELSYLIIEMMAEDGKKGWKDIEEIRNALDYTNPEHQNMMRHIDSLKKSRK